MTAAVAVPGLVVMSAISAGTFAFDFLAYHQAAGRVLAGERLYDPGIAVTGGFGLFYYPPPFALLMVPFGLLPADVATAVWLALSGVMLTAAIAILPVRTTVRWGTLLAAGLSWPVAYALKLGQVGPLLLLLFAIGWRTLDRPVPFGLVGAIGATVKIQPGLVLVWAVLTRRWAAVLVGGGVLVAAAVVATVATGGLAAWSDYLALLRNVSDPITTPHNFTPGSVTYQLGAPVAAAVGVQVASTILAAGAVIFAALRLRADASFLVATVASQLLSPVLWDHYAMLLLLPVAWLLERRQWWVVVIPAATSVVLLPFGLPPVAIPISFWVTMLALLAIGWRERGEALPARG